MLTASVGVSPNFRRIFSARCRRRAGTVVLRIVVSCMFKCPLTMAPRDSIQTITWTGQTHYSIASFGVRSPGAFRQVWGGLGESFVAVVAAKAFFMGTPASGAASAQRVCLTPSATSRFAPVESVRNSTESALPQQVLAARTNRMVASGAAGTPVGPRAVQPVLLRWRSR